MGSSTLNKRIAVGTVWMLLLRFFVRGIGLFSTMILARLLSPGDYGLVALAMSVYALLEMFSAFGFDVVLVQKQDLEEADYHSAWTARLICFLVLACIFVLSADYVSAYYNEPNLSPVIYALALQMILTGLDNIALVDFRRELQFDKEFKLQVSVKVIGFCITIPLAFVLKNYWALVIGSVVSKFSAVLIGYYLRPFLPRISFAKTREIMNFSKWLLLMNMAQFLRAELPKVVLGKVVSTHAVGLYSISAELAKESTQAIIASMNRPAYSGFAKLVKKPQDLIENYLKLASFQALFVLPIGFGLSVSSESLVAVLFGSKWLAAIEPLSILSISLSISALTSLCQYLYLVKGKPVINFIVALVGLTIFAPQIIWYTQEYGLIGAVYAHFITCLIMTIINLVLVSQVMKVSILRIISVWIRPLFSALLMYLLIAQLLDPYFRSEFSMPIVVLAAVFLTGAFLYVFFVMLLWYMQGKPDGAEKYIIGFIGKSIFKKSLKQSSDLT